MTPKQAADHIQANYTGLDTSEVFRLCRDKLRIGPEARDKVDMLLERRGYYKARSEIA